MVAVATPEVDAGMWVPATHFAIADTYRWSPAPPNLQQPTMRNKTTRLEKSEGLRFDGD
jgi:hypothetical protein